MDIRETAMRALVAGTYRFLQEENGPTAVEYAVMLAMIILVCFVVARQLGTTVSRSLSTADSMLK
jgi:pilus assembly protein Flp/PilA